MSQNHSGSFSGIDYAGSIQTLQRVAQWLKRSGLEEESRRVRGLLKSAVPINDIEGIPHLNIEPGAFVSSKSFRPGFYIYVLKLHNIIDGKQVYSEDNPELPIYNWYVGKAINPASRLRQHQVRALSIAPEAQARLRSYLGQLEAKYSTQQIIENKKLIEDVVSEVFREFPDMFTLDSSNIPVPNYIGREYGPEAQPSVQEHNARCGSLWTSLHGVIEMVWNKHFDSTQSVAEKENEMYREMVNRYGENHVRGGSYCKPPGADTDMHDIMTSEYTAATDNSFPSNTLDADASEIIKYLDSAKHSDEEVVEGFRTSSWRLDGIIRDIYESYKKIAKREKTPASGGRARRSQVGDRRLQTDALWEENKEHFQISYVRRSLDGPVDVTSPHFSPKSDFFNTRILKEIKSGGDNPFPLPETDELWNKILDYYRNFSGESYQRSQLARAVKRYIYLTFLSSRKRGDINIGGVEKAFQDMLPKRSQIPRYIELRPDGQKAPKRSILELINMDLKSPDGLLGSLLPNLASNERRKAAKIRFDKIKSIARNPNADLAELGKAISFFIKGLETGLKKSVIDELIFTKEGWEEIMTIRMSINSLMRQEKLDGLLATAKNPMLRRKPPPL